MFILHFKCLLYPETDPLNSTTIVGMHRKCFKVELVLNDFIFAFEVIIALVGIVYLHHQNQLTTVHGSYI